MAVSVKHAFDLINYNLKTAKYEIIPIENSLGRISAEDIFATYIMPRYNNSAMDGYGVICKDSAKKVKVIDTVMAGDKKTPVIEDGSCIKIMTGARVPDSVEAVVPQELVEILNDDEVILPENIQPYSHIKFIGEDIKNGELLVKQGSKINYAKITLLTSQGVTHLKVFRKPRVTIFASGEELKLHYEKIEEHQIYNTNTPTLIARAQELGCEVNFIGMAKDNIENLEELIKNSLDTDLIVTSGGVSVGEADFTKEAFENLGMEIIFSGIVIKPGKPTTLGKIENTTVLNLPGNPLASALIFEFFGKIIIQRLSGSNNIYHNYISAKLSESLENKKGRITITPGYFDGEFFEVSLKRSPGMINVLPHCNSIMVLDENVENLEKNVQVKILPIDWEFLTNEDKDYLTYATKH